MDNQDEVEVLKRENVLLRRMALLFMGYFQAYYDLTIAQGKAVESVEKVYHNLPIVTDLIDNAEWKKSKDIAKILREIGSSSGIEESLGAMKEWEKTWGASLRKVKEQLQHDTVMMHAIQRVAEMGKAEEKSK